MTRDKKTLSAVFMAVLLVLASGTAVSLAVTGSTADAGANAVGVQETTTAQNGEETTRQADEPANGGANVTINEQQSNGERIVVESATLPEGGFIAIHDSSVAEAPLASVLGNSVYLEPGTHENVTITLARPITESQTLVAMPHFDTNNNQVYDFVLSTGEVDGPYTTDGQVLVDQANVTVAQEETTTTEAEAEETTTTEEEVEETTTTEEDVVETTTTEEEVEETTTTEADVEETTTEADAEETTTTEEVVDETTTEGEVEETTTAEAPEGMEQFVFKIEQMNIDRWSFVIGDEETPDRTQTISNVTITDRRVTINLTKVLQQSAAAQQQAGPITTVSPEKAEQMIEENLSQDLQTVRYVISDVTIENVTFVVTAPEDIELPQPPMTTTTAQPEETTTTEEEVEETTTTEEVVEETTTTTEDVVNETTTTEEVEETTTTEEVVEETTTTEEEVEETTTTEEEAEETTTTEGEVEETTTTEEVVGETTTTEEGQGTAAGVQSFEVAQLDAPDSATAGDNVTVSATVSNPNDQQATQQVAFRLEGTVVARQNVTLDAGEQTTVEFEVGTEGVPAGQYIHGVYTRDFGELGVIVIEEPSEETTAAAETETPGNETTTAAA
ncbi:hypothetical protein M0R89_05075 [Halorussus limi]|uniref:DUF7282 domain-containing protein n=1 Tax=Halorussus limi TaxID=2938695 RepID=A0A8U0HXI6_9EURY|nr:hypothetical protein [Halorussus limi]UPV75441.1 hypothetical protein M0R89_05075 [Halorussus limi]